MSTTKIISLAAGLSAIGLCGLAATFADGPPPPIDAPPAAAKDASAPKPSVLLETNGRVHRGIVVETTPGYAIRHKIGTILVKRRDVEGVFDSIEAAYQHKKEHTPPRDPAERLKLARWCIEQKLPAEAREQLAALVELDPDDRQASAMLANLDNSAARAVDRDAAIARAAVEVPDEMPRALDVEAIRKGSRGVVGAPAILDLSPAVAVDRYQKFNRYIQPILQRRCIACHDENSGRDFALIRLRTAKDARNETLLRTNLDATTRLVDGANLSASRLLTLAFQPHKPANKPLFTGPNDPEYRWLYQWVNSLREDRPDAARPPTNPVTTAPGTRPIEGFAVGRGTVPPVSRLGLDKGGYPIEAPGDPSFIATNPIINGPNSAQVGRPKSVATPPPPPNPGGAGYKVGDDGKYILLDENGVPIPEAPKKVEGRKPKDFKLDRAGVEGLLRKP